MASSHVIVLAGPNGAGKTTISSSLLKGTLEVNEFVNADIIAQGLSMFSPNEAAFQAGRFMLKRIRELADEKKNFAFETTLASKSFAPWIKKLCEENYKFHLIFLYAPNPEFCIKRVKDRVAMGGHHIPEDVIKRRYHSGLKNFFSLYQPLADSWYLYNNSVGVVPNLIAEKFEKETNLHDESLWQQIKEKYYA